MSILTVNSQPVVSAEIRMPRVGVCNADLLVDAELDVSGTVVISTDDRAFVLIGRATRDLVFLQSLRFRFVLGLGDLDLMLDPKAYSGFTVRAVIDDIMQETGSGLSVSTDTSILNTFLPSWTRLGQQRAKSALEAILTFAGASSWRVLGDGTVWATRDESWASVDGRDFEVAGRSSSEGWTLIECEQPFALPGQTITLPNEAVGSGSPQQRISAVTHIVKLGLVQSRLYLEDAA